MPVHPAQAREAAHHISEGDYDIVPRAHRHQDMYARLPPHPKHLSLSKHMREHL